MSPSWKILIGVALGVALGLMIGEGAARLQIVADVYIRLLQMTVLPYVTISLISGLGSLRPADARALSARCGLFLLLLWGVAIVAVFLFPLVFPTIETATFFSHSLVEQREPLDFIGLYVPSNPFNSLANSVVPAVVLFSVLIGIALINIPHKERLLDVLHVASVAVGKASTMIVNLAPYGLFAVAAVAAGTLGWADLEQVEVYLISYIAIALLLSLWVLPGLVAALTPIPHKALLKRSGEALITAFMTGSLFVVLPALTDSIKALLREHHGLSSEDTANADVIVSASFNFPSTSKVLALSFVLFAGWSANSPVPVQSYLRLAGTGLLVFFGNLNGAVPFLLDAFRIPHSTFQLFLTTNVINSRFGSLLSAVHTLSLGLLGTCALAGVLHVTGRRLVRFAAVTVALTVVTVGGARLAAAAIASGGYTGDRALKAMSFEHQYSPARVVREPVATSDIPHDSPGGGPLVERIRTRGVLRVGYLPDSLPYAFFNAAGDLVGFDVEMAHILAKDIGVSLLLVPVQRERLTAHFDGEDCDLIMSGVAVTTDRASVMTFSAPYLDETLAFVVPDYLRGEFSSWDTIRSREKLRLGTLPLPYYLTRVREELPRAEIVTFDSIEHELAGGMNRFDAVALTAERGSAWTLLHPAYSVAVPLPRPAKIPLAYPIAARDEGLAALVNSWIGLKQKDGTIDRLFTHWILGQSAASKTRRWSIARDVLHWID